MGRITEIIGKHGLKPALMVSRDLIVILKFYILDRNKLFSHDRLKRLIHAANFFDFQIQLNNILGMGFDFTNQTTIESRMPLLRYLIFPQEKPPSDPLIMDTFQNVQMLSTLKDRYWYIASSTTITIWIK